jgi:hypothetical protein
MAKILHSLLILEHAILTQQLTVTIWVYFNTLAFFLRWIR